MGGILKSHLMASGSCTKGSETRGSNGTQESSQSYAFRLTGASQSHYSVPGHGASLHAPDLHPSCVQLLNRLRIASESSLLLLTLWPVAAQSSPDFRSTLKVTPGGRRFHLMEPES